MKLFESNDLLGWSRDDAGLAIFFKSNKDHVRATTGNGNANIRKISNRFQRLLECGDADVESALGGIYLPTSDAVRLDPETRELFQLPPAWPGYLRLDTHSVPNLDSFDAVLRLVDIHGHIVSNWNLNGPILEIGSERYLPDSLQFACLRAYENWRVAVEKRETDHLRFIHTLTDAADNGCQLDVKQAGTFRPSVSAQQNPSILRRSFRCRVVAYVNQHRSDSRRHHQVRPLRPCPLYLAVQTGSRRSL